MRATARRTNTARRLLSAYAFWWPALHVLLCVALFAVAPVLRWAAGQPVGVSWDTLATQGLLASLGVLAAVWAARLRRADTRAAHRRAAAWCLGLAVAYLALYLSARAALGWATPPPNDAAAWSLVVRLGFLLVAASLFWGAPLVMAGVDPLWLAVLYPTAVGVTGALGPVPRATARPATPTAA